MKILNFEIDKKELYHNLEDLADLNRVLVSKECERLLDFIDYSNDSIFLEPKLFFYPVENKSYTFTTSLEQILFGYINNRESYGQIIVMSDNNGYINLPNIGYLKTIPHNKFYLIQKNGQLFLYDKQKREVNYSFENFEYINNSTLKVYKDENELLYNYFITNFNDTVENTFKNNIEILNKSYNKLSLLSPDFITLLEKTNKEICVFNSKMPPYSLATLFYYGTAFINIDNNNHSEVFFIDDISHQCGHNLFYALTLEYDKYIKCSTTTPLINYTKEKGESRDVYGAFHGLFTYTTIIDNLSKYLNKVIYNNDDDKLEAQARLGFYMNKFNIDLKLLDNDKILTKTGRNYYNMFLECYLEIYYNNFSLYKEYTYNKQTYIFNFSIFKIENRKLIDG